MRRMKKEVTAGLLVLATAARAHLPPGFELPSVNPEIAVGWTFEAWVVVLLGASLAMYALGLARLWRNAGRGRGVSMLQAAAFAGGWVGLAAALVSPLDALGQLLFSAHMVQHELMMVVAAPLLVLGRPLAIWTWALPMRLRRKTATITHHPAIALPWQLITRPAVAWALHGLVLWTWHMPRFFDAALANDGIHTLQHVSFFGTALLFWWPPLASASRAGDGPAMFYLFTTMMHTAALGALLTLAPTPWYPAYAASAGSFGIDLLTDQQLGGLIMWVPAGVAYLAVGMVVAARTLQRRQPASG
ncbi:conserved membrane hypothetical protein [Burkholderiales bacterium 8X]|nr:conserved membrane hypothetical protein [Burkholderiales bacterium 8X]